MKLPVHVPADAARRRRFPVVATTLALLCAAPAAHALDAADCKSLEDDAKRLACYDAAAGRVTTPQVSPMPQVVEGLRGDVSGIAATPRLTTPYPVPGTKPSNLSERWDLDGRPDPALFTLRPYKPVYILPAFYSTSPNLHATSPNPENDATIAGPVDHLEGKFQYSLKAKMLDDLLVANDSLWLAYTQTSRWQVYNKERSRPFRESDYEPELIYTAPTHYSLGPIDGRLIGLSLTHQSNGRDVPQSRSWNRVIGQIGLESGDWTALVRPWLRIREKASRDDNADILDYVGRGEVVLIRTLGNQQIAVTLRHTLRSGAANRGSVAVDWAFPIYGYLKGHVQAFSGYGESLIDYNHHQNSFGLGISLLEWF